MAQKASKFLAKLLENFDLVFVTLCILSQFGIIYSDLPRGFESGKILAFSLVIIIGLVFVAAKILYSPKQVFNNLNKMQWGLVILGILISLCIAIITALSSEWMQVAVWGNFFRNTGLIFYAQLHVLFILIIIIAQRNHLIHYLNIFILVNLFQLPFVLSNLFGLNSIEQFTSGYYVGGSFGQSNFLAGQLISGFLVSIGIYIFYERKFTYLLACVTLALMVFTTMSRAGIIFLFLIPLLAFVLWKIKLKVNKIIAAMLSALLLVFLLAATTTFIWKTDEARSIYAKAAIELIVKKPLFGYGLDTFLEGSKLVGLEDRNVDRVHHMFLDIAYSLGTPLAIWAFLLLIAVLSTSSDKRTFLFSLPILVFIVTTVVHTKSAYHYVELSLFLGLWLVAYLDIDSWQYK